METKRNYIYAILLTLFFGGIGLHSHHARASPMGAGQAQRTPTQTAGLHVTQREI